MFSDGSASQVRFIHMFICIHGIQTKSLVWTQQGLNAYFRNQKLASEIWTLDILIRTQKILFQNRWLPEIYIGFKSQNFLKFAAFITKSKILNEAYVDLKVWTCENDTGIFKTTES